MKRLIKLLLSLAVFGWDQAGQLWRRVTGKPSRTRGVILYYHAVRSECRERFARQMDLLLRWAHPFRAEAPEEMRPGRLNAAVTFDDGFVSVLDHALPELESRTIPCLLFVPTGCFGRCPSWIQDDKHDSWKECVMTREQVRDVASRPLVTVGSHSVTHPNFLRLTHDQAEIEFRQAKADLEVIIGADIATFSFPHGAHHAGLVSQAHRSGYRRLYTVDPQPLHDPVDADHLVLGRVIVDPIDWPLEFWLKLMGAYRWQAARKSARTNHDNLLEAVAN